MTTHRRDTIHKPQHPKVKTPYNTKTKHATTMRYEFLLAAVTLCASACTDKDKPAGTQAQQPRTAVTTTRATPGSLERTVTLQAVTAYMNKTAITSPVAGYVKETHAQCGQRARAGQTLYAVESKEQHALGDSDGGAIIPIRAATDCVILEAMRQQGDYAAEGTTLCTAAETGSLAFIISVPYEQKELARSGTRLTVELPDGTRLKATVERTLPTVTATAQAQQAVARADTPPLPEGLTVKATFRYTSPASRQTMTLPKRAVQSDETLSEHWVMKLGSGGKAVKKPVTLTNSDAATAEIESDRITPQDDIILDGAYGLEDGAPVSVTKRQP